MKKASIFLLILIIGLKAYSQKNPERGDKEKTAQDNSNTKYTEGASGVKRSISYRFSSDVNAADPGDGTFRYNAGNILKAGFIYLDDIDLSGEDQTKWYKTWDDTTGATARGQLNIVEKDGKNINVFYVTGVFTHENGYWKIPVEYVSGTLPTDGATYFYIFNRISKKKDKDKAEPVTQVVPVKEQVVEVGEEKKEEQVKPVEQVVVAVEEKKEEVVKSTDQVVVAVEEKKEEAIKPVEKVAEVIQEKKEEKPVEQIVSVVEVKKEEQVKPTEQVVVAVGEKKEEAIKPVEKVAEVIQERKEEKPVEQIVPVVEVKKEEQVKPVKQVVVAVKEKKEEVVKSFEKVEAAVEEKKEEVIKLVEKVAEVIKEKKEEKPVEQVVPVVEVNKEEQIKPTEQVVVAIEEKKREPIPDERINRKVETDPLTQRREMPQTGPIAEDNGSRQSTTRTSQRITSDQTGQVAQSTQTKPATQNTQNSRNDQVTVQTSQKKQTTQSTQDKQAATQTTEITQKSTVNQTYQNTYTTSDGHTYQTRQTKAVQNAQSNNNSTAGTSTSGQNKLVTTIRQEIPSTPSTQGTLGSQGYHSVSTFTSEASSATVRGKKWWHGIIEAGYGFGTGEYGMNNFRLNFINAIQIGRCSTIGLGIGYRRLFDNPRDQDSYLVRYFAHGEMLLPVFLDLRTNFSTRKVTPYLALGIGNSLRVGSSEMVNAGMYICPSGGIWFNISQRLAFFGGVAYEIQKLEFASYSDNMTYKKNSGSLSINLGISF